MLFITKTMEPMWGKYTSDCLCFMGRYFPGFDTALNEDEIDNWILNKLSDEAVKTITVAPANGRYRKA